MEHLAWTIIITASVCMVVGIFIGIWIGVGRMKKAVEDGSVGNLRIDRSEPDEPPKPFLEVTNATIETISRKDFVILKVINENYLR
jgi:hypothetical protein